MNLASLIIPIAPIALCIVAIALSYLFSRAFESASRNTESIDFIQSQLLIGVGLVELSSILIVGLFIMVFVKIL